MVTKVKDRKLYIWDSENDRVGDPDTKYTQYTKPGPKLRYTHKASAQITEDMANSLVTISEELDITVSEFIRKTLAKGIECHKLQMSKSID